MPMKWSWILAAVVACGGSSPSQDIPGLSVGGSYDTQVSLLPDGNTCGSVQVMNNPTSVAHSPGSRSLTLTHASFSDSGTVDPAGRFTVPPMLHGGTYNISIAGQFSQTGFTATVVVDPQQLPCEYKVAWVGTKNGAPNTFP